MVIFRNHHPLDWTEDEFHDALFNTATSWYTRITVLASLIIHLMLIKCRDKSLYECISNLKAHVQLIQSEGAIRF